MKDVRLYCYNNILLVSCPWGPVTANVVDLLTEIYAMSIGSTAAFPPDVGKLQICEFMLEGTRLQPHSNTIDE